MTLARCQDTAEELTQQTFVKALVSYKSFKGESSELTWLCSIAKNLFLDEKRNQKKAEKITFIETEITSNNEELVFKIHKALHSLNEPYKEVFHLRIFGDLSFEKIGKIFGKNTNWACVTYHRARIKIKEILEKL